MAMELKHLNPQHVMDVTGKAIDEISRLRAENAELKQKLQDQCISCPVKMQEDDVVAELKAKLEDAKATAYAESVDAGMRERRLKRALYKACANWAHHRVFVRYKTNEKAWENVERKCLKKSKEYL